MDVFLSYSSADKKMADRLKKALQASGLSVWCDDDKSATEWHHRVEEAIRSASRIVVLVGPRDGVDEAQQFTWRVALEAVWQDPHKRLIPVLLPGAKLPSFVRSGTAGELQVIRVEQPRKLENVAGAVKDLIQGERIPPPPETSKTGFSVVVDSKRDESRGARLSEIAEYAELLRFD